MRISTTRQHANMSKALGAWAAVVGALLTVVLLVAAPQAGAAMVYEQRGSFGEAYTYYGTQGVVDDSTGHLLRVDPYGTYVEVFSPDGDSATLLTQFDLPPGASVFGIAIDQTTQAVYLSDAYGGVYRYTTDGLPVPTYTRDLTYPGPTLGSEPGQIGQPGRIAIDPRNGDLLVVDVSSSRISRYSSDGAFVGSFDGADAPTGAFHAIQDIEVDAAGDVYVSDVVSGQIEFDGTSVVHRFAADGSWEGNLDAQRPSGIGIDLASGNVVVGNYPSFSNPAAPTVEVFNGGTRVQRVTLPSEHVGRGAMSIAVDSGPGRRMYVLTRTPGSTGVQAYDAVEYPDVTLDPPSAVTDTTAHISGSIDPLGYDLTYRFEHSDDGTTWTAVGEGSLSGSAGPTAVSADLTDLRPNLEHRVRLSVTTSNGTYVTTSVPLQTDPASPGVVTGRALDRTATGATLRGTVDPFGLQATYHFEYGTTTDYGSRAPGVRDAVVGGGQGARHVAQVISGLQPGTTYHYRLVADSSQGTRHGADRTFTTPPVGEVLGYEQVSPVDKGNSNVNSTNVQSSPNGDAVAFEWVTAPGGTSPGEAAPQYPRSSALRGPAAWTAFALDAPQTTSERRPALNTTVMAVSRDGRKALVTSYRKLADGAVEDHSNLYIRDVATGAYTTVATVPDRTFVDSMQYLNGTPFVDGTVDWSHLLLTRPGGSLVPGDPVGALYDWTGGELRLVSIDPAGETVQQVAGGGSSQALDHGRHYVSADGARIFFHGYDGSFSPTPLYARVNGTETVPVSVSERADDAGAPVKPGTFVGASADGRYVYLTSNEPLTDDDVPPGTPNLYEVDMNDGDVELIAGRIAATDVRQVAARGRSVYFETDVALVPEDGDSALSMYVWRAGVLSYIASPARGRISEYMVSPSGRYLGFTSYSALTDYDTASSACNVGSTDYEHTGVACRAAYRYDAETGELLCASCRPDGKRLTGNTTMGKVLGSADWGGHYFSRAVVDDGTVFFDTPEPLSAHDANSARDVYAFDGEQATLISAGTGEGHSLFGDASADGRSVFFTTEDKLVGQDGDSSVDLYVARMGGGLPQDAPPARPAPCGQGCQHGTLSPLERTLPSATLRGRGDAGVDGRASARFAKLSTSVRARLARTGRARITVRVNRAGRVAVRARARLSRGAVTVARGSTVAKRPGLASVTLKLSRPARRVLASRGKLTLRLSLTLAGRPTAKARLDLRRTAQARRATAPTTTSGR